MNKKEFNIGFALLKLWMCFEVVLVHCWDGKVTLDDNWLLWFLRQMRNNAVPCFMIIAFFLAAKKFAANDAIWLKKRFARLLSPYVFWSVVSFSIFTACAGAAKDIVAPGWELLGWQLLLGTCAQIASQMWFQAVLIILTALFALFYRVVKPQHVIAALVVVFLAVVACEYSGLNWWLFDGKWCYPETGFRYEVRHPLGRVIPMAAYAAVGMIAGLNAERLAALSAKTKAFVGFVGLAVCVLIHNYPVFVVPEGFCYRGLNMLVFAMGLVTFFYFLPLKRLPERIKSLIVYLSGFSMGIYFTHILFGRLLEAYVYRHLGLGYKSFAAASLTFVICWCFCALVAKVPYKRIRSLVE